MTRLTWVPGDRLPSEVDRLNAELAALRAERDSLRAERDEARRVAALHEPTATVLRERLDAAREEVEKWKTSFNVNMAGAHKREVAYEAEVERLRAALRHIADTYCDHDAGHIAEAALAAAHKGGR